MHPNILDIHDEAGAEYDAAFEWYLARSPDSARKFDVEMNRALEQIFSLLGAGPSALTIPALFC